jgi:hypothetical protein
MNEGRAAALMVKDCEQALARSQDSILTVLLEGVSFDEWHHYPPDDVRDPVTGCRFYYHAHAATQRVEGEHGHFHTFAPGGDGELTHLAAISLDAYGRPFRIFTVNQWVTGDKWRPADETIGLVHRFVVDTVRPSWVVSRWVTALVAMYRPLIEDLLVARDREYSDRIAVGNMTPDAFLRDRGAEVLSQHPINLIADINSLTTA